MSFRIYLRILGYVVTLVMHGVNIIYMASFQQGEVMEDPEIVAHVGLLRRFLTCWTFMFQMIYALLGLSCDVLTLKNSENKKYQLPYFLSEARNTLFSAIIWPSSLQVATLFWPFYLYDKSLVFPHFLDRIITPLSNHIIHTAIVPVAIWELVLQPRSVPRSHSKYVSILSVYTLLYFAVMIYTYMEQSFWMYPIFGRVVGTIYLPILVVYVHLLLVFNYRSQWYVTSLLWGQEITGTGFGGKKIQ